MSVQRKILYVTNVRATPPDETETVVAWALTDRQNRPPAGDDDALPVGMGMKPDGGGKQLKVASEMNCASGYWIHGFDW